MKGSAGAGPNVIRESIAARQQDLTMKQTMIKVARVLLGMAVLSLGLATAGLARADGEVSVSKLVVKTEHNVTRDGRKGMYFHLRIEIEKARAMPCQVSAFFAQNGKWLRGIEKQYSSFEGNMCAFLDFTPKYDKTTLTGSMFMPYQAMVTKAGNFDLSFVVNVYCTQLKKYVARPFTGAIVLVATEDEN
jgi:hypothetical protein